MEMSVYQYKEIIGNLKNDYDLLKSYIAKEIVCQNCQNINHPKSVQDILNNSQQNKMYANLCQILSENKACKEELYIHESSDK
jgi:hypothetical protein